MPYFKSDDELSLFPIKLLGGYNAAELWPLNNVILLTWILLVVAPRWRHTPTLTLIGPVLTALIYVGGILSTMVFSSSDDDDQAPPDFTTLHGVVNLFQDHTSVFIGWTHYIVFDALVGRMIVQDSIERNATTLQHILFVVPCLFFTLMLGPSGWLAYTLLCHFVLQQKGSIAVDEEMLLRSMNYERPSKKFA